MLEINIPEMYATYVEYVGIENTWGATLSYLILGYDEKRTQQIEEPNQKLLHVQRPPTHNVLHVCPIPKQISSL